MHVLERVWPCAPPGTRDLCALTLNTRADAPATNRCVGFLGGRLVNVYDPMRDDGRWLGSGAGGWARNAPTYTHVKALCCIF